MATTINSLFKQYWHSFQIPLVFLENLSNRRMLLVERFIKNLGLFSSILAARCQIWSQAQLLIVAATAAVGGVGLAALFSEPLLCREALISYEPKCEYINPSIHVSVWLCSLAAPINFSKSSMLRTLPHYSAGKLSQWSVQYYSTIHCNGKLCWVKYLRNKSHG